MALKLELAAARLQQAEAEAQRNEKAAQSYRQQYEGAADIVAEMGQKYQSFEQGIQQNMEARLPCTALAVPVKPQNTHKEEVYIYLKTACPDVRLVLQHLMLLEECSYILTLVV